MTDDSTSPAAGDDDGAAVAAARTRSSAENAASELARMGIDPRALGLQAATPPDRSATIGAGDDPRASGAQPAKPVRPEPDFGDYAGNVVPLRPGQAGESGLSGPQLPQSGTSSAWEPAPREAAVDPRPPLPPASPLEGLLGRGPFPDQQRPPVAARLARAVTFGMITPDAAEAADREREMIRRVRTRQTDRRVVVFLAGKGGVGTTTVAVGVGHVLVSLRDDATSLTSLRSGTPSLGKALAGVPAPRARDLVRTDIDVEPLALSNGLLVVDGPRWATPVRSGDVPVVLDRLGQLSTFCLFDVGNDTSESAASLLGRADQVVIVSGPGADGLDAAAVAAERAVELDPYLLDSAIYVVVCQRDAALRSVVRAMRAAVAGSARVVAVPPEDSLADGLPFDAGRVSVGTRLAMIDVAGLVAAGSVSLSPGSRA